MSEFVPGHEYDHEEVLRELDATKVRDSFVLGRHGVALIAKLGEANGEPCFPDRSTYYWPGDAPKRVVEHKTDVFIFVDRGEKTIRFIGQGRAVSYFAGQATPRNVRFHIRPSLSRADWLDFIGGCIPPADPAPEEAFAKLTTDSSPDDRWAALKSFLERWYQKPIGDSPDELQGVVGPPLLQKILGVQTMLPEIIQQNQLVRPEKLVIEDGRIIFLMENQAVCLWATEPEGEDPRVWYRNNDEGEPWIEEPEHLSGLLIQTVLFEAFMNSRFGASITSVSGETLDAILARVDRLAGGRWNWGGAHFYAHDGALVMTMESPGDCSVWLAAKTPLALTPFEDLVDEGWDYVAF